MPFFSERLVFRRGSTEVLLRDAVILVSTGETVPQSEDAGQVSYHNRSVRNFIDQLITEAGHEDLPSLRSYVPAALNPEIDEFCCPITLVPMRDPVVAVDGVTYEREALEMWLASSASRGKTPLHGRMVNADGTRLPMPRNLLLASLITEHANHLQHNGVEYEIGVDFSDFQPDRWTAFLERAKLRFTAAFASGLVVTLALLRFLGSLDSSQLTAISSGTTSVAVGTTVGSAAFTLASAINIGDATVTGSTVFAESSSVMFSSRGSRPAGAVPGCAPGNNG